MLVVSGLTPTKTERREENTTKGGLWRRWRVAGDSGKLYRKAKERKKAARTLKKTNRKRRTRQRKEEEKGDPEAKKQN